MIDMSWRDPHWRFVVLSDDMTGPFQSRYRQIFCGVTYAFFLAYFRRL